MSHLSRTLGVIRDEKQLLAAVVSNDGSRLSVTKLIESGNGDGHNDINKDDFSNSRLFFGVSPEIAIVKKIRLETAPLANSTELVAFEMSQSLLEPPDSFYFDTLPVGSSETKKKHQDFLSIAYHRHQIDSIMNQYKSSFRSPSGFKLEAVALVDGYLAFCHRDPGQLEAILDLCHNRVTIAFVYKDQLYAVGSLPLQHDINTSEQAWSMIASEIKMMIDFQLSRFFEEGVTVPLSRVIISGKLGENSLLRAALGDRLSMPVNLPRFHDGYFQSLAETLGDLHPERFLIPLGLAVV